jgi:hypothetical protein
MVLILAIPTTVDAASESEAWLSARQAWITRSAALAAAARDLVEGGPEDVGRLRRAVAAAIDELDALEVHDCFRVWWSYVRTSYLLFEQALIGMEQGDVGQVQVAVSSSRYLAAPPSGIGSARRGGDGQLVTPMAPTGTVRPRPVASR